MAEAISSCIAKTSVIGRSYRSDHNWVPSAAAINWAVTRIRSPARRTLPSRTLVTPSACAMRRTSSFLPLNENAEVRAITFRPSTCASALMISSARPSPKYSFSRSALRLANGSTAIDAVASAVATVRWCRACLTSAIVWNRLSGSLARQRLTIRCTASGASSGLGSSRSTALRIWAVESPVKARVPASSSYSTAPKLNTSDRASSGLAAACSGDMYAGVPITSPPTVLVAPGSAREVWARSTGRMRTPESHGRDQAVDCRRCEPISERGARHCRDQPSTHLPDPQRRAARRSEPAGGAACVAAGCEPLPRQGSRLSVPDDGGRQARAAPDGWDRRCDGVDAVLPFANLSADRENEYFGD